jgi:hypothetical protein
VFPAKLTFVWFHPIPGVDNLTQIQTTPPTSSLRSLSSSHLIIHCHLSKWNLIPHYFIQIVRRPAFSIMPQTVVWLYTSLCRWQRLHIDPPYPRRWPHDVRTSFRTLESRSERWEGHPQCDFDACRQVLNFLIILYGWSSRYSIFRAEPGEWRQYWLLQIISREPGGIWKNRTSIY